MRAHTHSHDTYIIIIICDTAYTCTGNVHTSGYVVDYVMNNNNTCVLAYV